MSVEITEEDKEFFAELISNWSDEDVIHQTEIFDESHPFFGIAADEFYNRLPKLDDEE